MGNKTSKKSKKPQQPMPTMYPLDDETIRVMRELYNITPAIHNPTTAQITHDDHDDDDDDDDDDDEDRWSSNTQSNNNDDDDNIDESPQKSSKMQPVPQLIDKNYLYHELLVYGYAREIESLLSKLIPLAVVILCCEYYEPPNKVILIYLPLEDEQIYCQKIMAEGKHGNRKTEQLKVFALNNQNELKQETMSRTGDTIDTFLLQRNMSLPKSVTNKLCKGYNKYYNCDYRNFEFDTYSLLFSLNSVVAVNEKEFDKNESDIIGIKWDIPHLPNNSRCLQFSDFYGLLGFAGYRNNIYNLSFNNDHYFDQNMSLWKWRLMTTAKKRRNSKTMSSVMIDHNKLMLIGGLSGDDCCAEIIDLQRKKTKRSNTLKPRNISGIVFDENKKRVLIAGGDQYLNTEVEIYDTFKDKWTLYDGTYVVHYERPILWITNNDILYMATCKGDVKYIDLRSNTKQWMIHQEDEFGIGSYVVIG